MPRLIFGNKGTRRIFGRLILYFVSSQILRFGILFVSSRYSNFFLFDNFLSLHVSRIHTRSDSDLDNNSHVDATVRTLNVEVSPFLDTFQSK